MFECVRLGEGGGAQPENASKSSMHGALLRRFVKDKVLVCRSLFGKPRKLLLGWVKDTSRVAALQFEASLINFLAQS